MFVPSEWPTRHKSRTGNGYLLPQTAASSATTTTGKHILSKMITRRRLLNWTHLACRLPLLILWTLIVLIITFMLLDSRPSNNDDPLESAIERQQTASIHRITRQNGQRPSSDQLLIRTTGEHGEDQEYQLTHETNSVSAARTNLKNSQRPAWAPSSSTTRKSPTSEYARQSDIFILIVQDPDSSSKINAHQYQQHSQAASSSNLYPSSPSSSSSSSSLSSNLKQTSSGGDGGSSIDQQRKLVIPTHIRQLIEILDAHRIGYTIDTSRHGLPKKLLEANNKRTGRRYSVIVVDDFIKYTKLNRWLRDQLDRYCRSNRIGVITYLVDNHKLDHHLTPMMKKSSSKENQLNSIVSDNISDKTDKRSMADQFPLTFEPIQQNCRNLSSSKCLRDYQLNNRVQILRILKNKEDFVIKGELTASDSPIMTMFTNHITYEPLTWARLREPHYKPLHRTKRHNNAALEPESNNRSSLIQRRRMQSDDNNTQQIDQTLERSGVQHHRHKRAVLSGPVKVTNQEEQYGFKGVDDADQALDDNQRRPPSSEQDYSAPVKQVQNPGPAYDIDLNSSDSSPLGNDSSSLSSQQPLDRNHHRSSKRPPVVSDDGEDDDRDDWAGKRVLSIIDHGLYDGIKRVIFGLTNNNWLDRILLLDSIEHLSSGEIMTPLERYIQIDIDDIFVGERGTRLKRNDVEALIETQRQFANAIEGGFKFNLGFSGKYFKHGNELEQEGDEFLVQQADEFTWFCHFWSHSKAHLFNDTDSIATELKKNLKFAQENGLTLIGHAKDVQYDSGVRPLPPTYAVAPHHSGVYPIHEQLYEAWRTILNVKVTSTEEYPHLRPASGRRGFVHKSIKVLPRQTCGLYTHTIFKHKYPGGIDRLVSSIRGGELFETILHNPVNIYMSHMSNYANDRLAPYTFKALFEFVREHTNLRLRYAPSDPGGGTEPDLHATDSVGTYINPDRAHNLKRFDNGDGDDNRLPTPSDQLPQLGPLQLAEFYFSLYPNEQEPLYTNPCHDKRHIAIWSVDKHKLCRIDPMILIVGPQKTGTTALHSFLKLNPAFKTSSQSDEDFEEVQFFNDKHYWRGTDWYFNRFSHSSSSSSSATTANDRDEHGTRSKVASGDINLIERIRKSVVEPTTGSDGSGGGDDLNENGAGGEFSYYVDKSATYFDDPKVARRASSLLPDAFIIILLIDPADRAYSWYQHIKAHGDVIANEFTFEQIIMHNSNGGPPTTIESAAGELHDQQHTNDNGTSSRPSQVGAIRALRQRCLHPGYYSSHLSQWLAFYPSRRIIIIDGEWFKYNPAAVLNRLQLLLRVPRPLDYSHLLAYSERKGFYCERVATAGATRSVKVEDSARGGQPEEEKRQRSRRQRNGHRLERLKCLGSGKGRQYEPMSREARSYLNNHYWEHNRQLAKLLYEIGQPLPTWLDESINQLALVTTQRERQATAADNGGSK